MLIKLLYYTLLLNTVFVIKHLIKDKDYKTKLADLEHRIVSIRKKSTTAKNIDTYTY